MKKEIEDLRYELSVTLEAMLLYAGVNKNKLNEAVQTYIECIDEVLENSNEEGVNEILVVVDYLKQHHKELFEN